MTKTTNLVFLTTSLLFLVVMTFNGPIPWLFKVLPIATLFWIVTTSATGVIRNSLWAALLFSAAGDILLELDFFIPGVAAFLLAQLCYAMLFVRSWNGIKRRWPISLVLLVYISAMVVVLFPNLGSLQVPVFAYLIVIAFMGLLATQSSMPLLWGVLGAFVFIASDSLIAIDKFVHPIAGRSYWIMVTYYAAQWMLVSGFIASARTNR